MDAQASIPPPPPPPPPGFITESITTVQSTPAPAVVQPTSTVQDRIWLHPWTSNEMRDNASQWSLAGDNGLLLFLEQFSDRLVQRADTIQEHLAQTVNAVKSTQTRVQNCLNEFLSLSNTQFIENRVYDEDETVNSTPSKKDEQSNEKSNVNVTDAQEKVLQRYVEAIQCGLSVLDTHFERVDPKLENGSSAILDGDDDEGGNPMDPILEPKDPYILRPLPHIIGTSEFIQDNYIGLGDILNTYDDEILRDDQPEHIEIHDEETSDDDDDETPPPSINPVIVPAGESRANIVTTRAQTTSNFLSDSEDDDDPFGEKNVVPKLPDPVFTGLISTGDTNGSKKKSNDPFAENTDDDDEMGTFGIATTTKRTVKTEVVQPMDDSEKMSETIKQSNGEEEDDEEDEEEEEEEQSKTYGGTSIFGTEKKGLSELEQAVRRRFAAMNDGNPPESNESEEEEKPIKRRKKPTSGTISSIAPQPAAKSIADKPPSSTISQLVSQPLTDPKQTTQKSIFGDEGDDDDIFNDVPVAKPSPTVVKTTTTTTTTTTASTVTPSKPPTTYSNPKTKGLFDDNTDDEDDPFKPKKVVTPVKPVETKAPPVKKTTVVPDDDSGDEIFQKKSDPVKPSVIDKLVIGSKPIVKAETPSSDEELFKENPKTTKPASKPVTVNPTPQPTLPPAAPLSKKVISSKDDSSDDELFGDKKKTSKTTPTSITVPQPIPTITAAQTATPVVAPSQSSQKIISSTPDEDNDLFGIVKPTSKTVETPISEVKRPEPVVEKPKPVVEKPKPRALTDSDDELFSKNKPKTTPKEVITPKKPVVDDEDNLFSPKPFKAELPPPVSLPPLPSAPATKTPVDEDPLFGIRKPVESTPKPTVSTTVTNNATAQKKPSLSDSDEDFIPRRPQNQAALQDGEKPDVKRLSAKLDIKVDAFKPGGVRPKPPPTVVETHKETNSDDETPPPVSKVEVKKKPALNLDSDGDDDALFGPKAKVTPSATPKEEKPSSRVSIKERGMMINPLALSPGAQSKPIVVPKENESTPSATEESTKEEVPADKAMLNIMKDRAKVTARNRAPPTRKGRSTPAAAAATNDMDDFFAPSTNPTATATDSTPTPVPAPAPAPTPAPAPAPATTTPVATIVPPVASPSVSSTGSHPSATIANKTNDSKEKKKFSLFDSDDSDIDQLLFGSSQKKKPTTESKPTSTTNKTAAKSTILTLDDDDNDFLLKRPAKKSTKPAQGDDIFADVNIKTQQTNKAKKDWSIMNKGTDDIFNEPSSSSKSKSSTNTKSKSNKEIDDIFDDPLNVVSKR